MSRDDLSEAANQLLEAAEEAGEEFAERLREQAEQLRSLADRDRGPDHGRLARHQQKLNDIEESVEAAVAERIGEARDRISSYREDLEGV